VSNSFFFLALNLGNPFFGLERGWIYQVLNLNFLILLPAQDPSKFNNCFVCQWLSSCSCLTYTASDTAYGI
jgi:hypothetical protein